MQFSKSPREKKRYFCVDFKAHRPLAECYFATQKPTYHNNKQLLYGQMDSLKKKKLGAAAAVLLVLAAVAYWLIFAAVSRSPKDTYIYIDRDDTPDSVYTKIASATDGGHTAGLKLCGTLMAYGSHVHAGRYLVSPSMGALRLMRNLRGGRQAPVSLVIPVVHTVDDLAGKLSHVLEADSATLSSTFRNADVLAELKTDTATLPCLFIPNTYEVYWDIAPRDLLLRMKKEHDAFWTPERTAQAKAAGLTADEAYTLASIVEQESANEAERPMIAGMYLNRLHTGMKLQADPTVKFALHDFALRRIMHKHLTVDSPYNTYLHEGLPAGPICIPSLSSINAVLHYSRHNYLYMCAKEDFSGTHNFAVTYEEHLQNAKRYADALNARGISSESTE